MSKTAKAFSLLLLFFIALTNLALKKVPDSNSTLVINDQTTVWEVMTSLGKTNVNNIDKGRQFDAAKGEQLIRRGITYNFNGKKTAPMSPKLSCIACHSLQAEHPKPSTMNPQSRLEYADSMGLPFLPGAPFVGLVNRIAFFTNDYQEIFTHKYKQSLEIGHKNIRKAIQGCNTVYGKGRMLDAWEVESILAFLWKLELKIGDLKIPKDVLSQIQESVNTNIANSRAVNLMRRYYMEVYPASLAAPIPLHKRGQVSPVLNDFNNGRRVYKTSCLYCHANKKFANFSLDRQQKTFKFLKKHLDSTSPFSIYDAIRYSPGSKANRKGVPHYTAQRMSDQQVQDLRFYITQMAKLGSRAKDYYPST